MTHFFHNLKAAAYNAIAAFYQSILSQAVSTSADELSEWHELDTAELGLSDDEGPVYAKRVSLPMWDIVDPDHSSSASTDLLLELETRCGLYAASYEGDKEYVVYLTNVQVGLDALREAFDDEEYDEEYEEELYEEEQGDAVPQGGRVLSVVPRLPLATPSPEKEPDFEEEEPFEAESLMEEVVDAINALGEETAPATAPETAPAEGLTTEELGAVIEARTDYETSVDAGSEQNDRQEEQPEEQQETVDTVQQTLAHGPVQESPDVIAAMHAQKMQALIELLPADTISEIEEDGTLSLMYVREVDGQNVDYMRRIRIENENFQDIRYVDIFYIENESAHVIDRAMNPMGVIQVLENLVMPKL